MPVLLAVAVGGALGSVARHLLGTVMETLFNTGEVRLQSDLPREVVNVVGAGGGTIIRELF